jgi:hypothetical protein
MGGADDDDAATAVGAATARAVNTAMGGVGATVAHAIASNANNADRITEKLLPPSFGATAQTRGLFDRQHFKGLRVDVTARVRKSNRRSCKVSPGENAVAFSSGKIPYTKEFPRLPRCC